jgi:thiol-disulfide isomerase/thioredoxin
MTDSTIVASVKVLKAAAIIVIAAAVLIGAPVDFLGDLYMTSRTQNASGPLRANVRALAPLGTAVYMNTPHSMAPNTRGKVVLVNFWTYTCINWRRQLPYIRAWQAKYQDHGLVVIGVHSPEFAFEADLDNVRTAAKQMRITYPVAIDNDFGIWRAFANQYWPALYFIDARGRIRHQQFGEGDYERSELVIQRLLLEAGHADFDHSTVSVDARGAEEAADWPNLHSAESYLGSERADRHPAWTLAGEWRTGPVASVLSKAHGRITYRFHARDLHLIMAPSARGTAVRFRVLVDGESPGAARGTDVDEQGLGTVGEPRMYQLIRQPAPIVERTFEIEFLDPGVEVFAFTFG